jgi:nitrogen regulatory protein P-II 2
MTMVQTARVTLVTIIAAFELEDRLVQDLRRLGVRGYTLGKVDGRGLHGSRMAGLVDAPNLRLEALVDAQMAARILERIATRYVDQPLMAYTHEVQAMPAEHFE